MDRSDDGSIFIDRGGKHFGQVLEYLRDGVVSAADKDAADLDIGELRWLKREFGFYCIELSAELQEVAFVVGGTNNDWDNMASLERYDVESGGWREAAPTAPARADFSLCKLSDGELYATGGWVAHARTFRDVILASVERYDSSLDTWSAAPPLPRPRYSLCACALGNSMYVLRGIEQDEEGKDESVRSVLKFDCRLQTWSEVAPMPEERDNAGACVLGSGIYIFGRKTGNSTTYHFNTETNEWATLAPMPEKTLCHSVAVLDGLMYVMGGENDDDESISTVHHFDPVANLWSAVAPMSVARTTLGSFVLGGSIYAVGGFDGEENWSSMERYSVSSESWSEVLEGDLGTARSIFGVHVVQLEVDLFNSLSAKAKCK
jgi:hypothetical protein